MSTGSTRELKDNKSRVVHFCSNWSHKVFENVQRNW